MFVSLYINPLLKSLDGQSFKKAHSKVDSDSNNGPISPVGTPFNEFELKEVASDSQNDSMTEKDAEESARILAEFKASFFKIFF